MMMLVVLGVVLLGVFAFLAFVVGIYNGLVTARNRYKNAYAQIDVQLKRRYDLIPNLVETVKGYMAHEKGTLEAVIAARNQAVIANNAAAKSPGNPQAMTQLGQAEGALTAQMTRLFALSEAYPDLKANTNMGQLQEELTSTENKVSFARQAYNDAVTGYNNKRETFPNVLIAGPFGFGEATLLEVISAPTEREAPKVKFG